MRNGSFAVKQLYDYLDVSQIQAISQKGRIKLSKSYNLMQLRAIQKATSEFLESGASKIREVKAIAKEYSQKLDVALSLKQASTVYQSGKNYTWIYEYVDKSEFWDNAKVAVRDNWSKDDFVSQIARIGDFPALDESLQRDLEALFVYVTGSNVI